MSDSSNWKIRGGDGVVLEGVLKLRSLFSMGSGVILNMTHFCCYFAFKYLFVAGLGAQSTSNRKLATKLL